MSENKTSLDFLADPPFLRREFLFERVGWVFMGLVVVAAILGLFGNGLLSEAVLKNEQFQMKYHRFLHFGNLTSLDIEIASQKSEEGIVAIAFSNAYLHSFRIETIQPAPESSAHGDQILFWFTATGASEPVNVQIRLEPQKIGILEGKIFVNGEDAYVFRQFVYP
jgi:hypothetical protein